MCFVLRSVLINGGLKRSLKHGGGEVGQGILSPITYSSNGRSKYSSNNSVCMSDTGLVPAAAPTESQPSSSQQPHAQQGFVQYPSFSAMPRIIPSCKLVMTGNMADHWKVWKQM